MESATLPDLEPQALSGYSVLIVEDDYFIAQDMASTLRGLGARIIGPVPNVERARSLAAQHDLDCAILDINLKGELAFDLAGDLAAKGVRPIFATGYDATFVPHALHGISCLLKPVNARDLVQAIRVDGTELAGGGEG
jgi:DNA-binding response OmpR family regulator